MNIERMQPADFDAVYRLLTQSFPATERRGAAGQRALFSDSAYRVDILRAPDGDPLPMHLLTTGGACTSAELRAMETLVHTRVYGQAPAAEQ